MKLKTLVETKLRSERVDPQIYPLRYVILLEENERDDKVIALTFLS